MRYSDFNNKVPTGVLNLVPLFPVGKVLALILLYVATGDQSVFLVSISFVSISFFIRFVSGNPSALTKKFIRAQDVLRIYRILCVISSLILFSASFALPASYSVLSLTLLVSASKLMEAALVSILFEMSLCNDDRLIQYGAYFATLSIVFLFLTYYFGITVSISVDLFLMLITVLPLSHFVVGRAMSVKKLREIISSNYEITANVLPVSVFFLWYNNAVDLSDSNFVFLGYFALGVSTVGFSNRIISFFASYMDAVSYVRLSKVSHSLSLIAVALLLLHAHFDLAYYFAVMLMVVVVACFSIQNFIRINLYSNAGFSLLKIHLGEAALIMFAVLIGAPVMYAAVLLIVTRTSRLIYIANKDIQFMPR